MRWLKNTFPGKELDEIIQCYERKIARCRQEQWAVVLVFAWVGVHLTIAHTLVDWPCDPLSFW